jgi:hypothetical protein
LELELELKGGQMADGGQRTANSEQVVVDVGGGIDSFVGVDGGGIVVVGRDGWTVPRTFHQVAVGETRRLT